MMVIFAKIMETFLNLRGFYYQCYMKYKYVKYNLCPLHSHCIVFEKVKTMEFMVFCDDGYFCENNGNVSKFETFPLLASFER